MPTLKFELKLHWNKDMFNVNKDISSQKPIKDCIIEIWRLHHLPSLFVLEAW